LTLQAPDPLIPDESRVYFEVEVGGWGGHPEGDGANGFSCGFHNLANSPLEMCEVLFPMTFTEYGFIPGSGGEGQHRGGLGLAREWRLNSDWGKVSGSFERFRHGPYGLAGGKPGAPGRFLHITKDATVELPSKISGVQLVSGDRIRLETSGGGGWGDPERRTPQARANDERAGYV
jgi:N-methylhydantoinase B